MTLIGATMASLGSTALYVNIIVWALSSRGDPSWSNPYLNPFVFGGNVTSIINDVSMVLVCGVLKSLSVARTYFTFHSPRTNFEVMPLQLQPISFHSGAYED